MIIVPDAGEFQRGSGIVVSNYRLFRTRLSLSLRVLLFRTEKRVSVAVDGGVRSS